MNRRKQIWTATLTLGLALALGGCGMVIDSFKVDKAKNRVKTILTGIRDEGDTASGIKKQSAICMFYKEKMVINDLDELGDASDAFDAWRKKGRIFPTIDSYEVLDGKVLDHGPPAKVEVTGTIDGSEFRMEVTEGREIKWLKRPKRKRR